ncbi:MAG TPA: hypothetical protein VD978_07435 [Azospirillum sp.]|nr:hypothetical protein [Azospirillum sp.]
MPKSFIVAPLRPEHVDQALPVVQALRPSMTAAEWRGMAEDFVAPEVSDASASSGIVTCRTGGGHIRGLFCYALAADAEGRRLKIGPFIAAGLFDAHATASGLLEAIEHLAGRLGARAVEVDATNCRVASTAPRPTLEDLFLANGYRLAGRTLLKTASTPAQLRTIGSA